MAVITKDAGISRANINLVSGEVTALSFAKSYEYYAVRNDGANDFYISTEDSACTPNGDNVVCVKASDSYVHHNGLGKEGIVYFSGNGAVTVIGQDTGENPFKTSWKGGGSGGTAGKSAYEIALSNGFVGTQAQWLANLKGEKGDKGDIGAQGIRGEQGAQGVQGIQGIQGIKGDKGDDGYPFLIYLEYTDISEFDVNDFPEIGLMFMVKADGSDSFPVYRYTGNKDTPYSYVTSLNGGEGIKGDKGDKGDAGEQGVPGTNGADGKTYTPIIGNVTSGTVAGASVDVDEETTTARFNFIIPKGEKGNNGQDGKSITAITKDDNNNIIVTFSDNTTQNIGQLNIDVQADFLTSDGFGNLRYYNGHLQYYDTTTSNWIDTSVTPDNVYIMNMMPQPMVSIMGCYDTELGKYKLKWEEPADTIIDGQVACVVDKVIIRRKLGSAPADETDGDLVVEVKRNEFGQHKNNFYVDTALTANIDDVYYYKAFPVSTTGFYNASTLNETVGIKCRDYNLYGFKLDQNESDPASMITYLSDCDNAVYKSAYMNYAADTFDYGDWGDVWFIKKLKPCMLKYDGTMDYELDKNDYAKKADGTASDIANTAYDGNAMIGFPKVYWKIVDNGDNTGNIYICDKKLDDDFVCWSHIDNNGNEIDYCYMPIYTGGLVDSKLRSLSGLTPVVSKTRQVEINYAKANNLTDDIIWYTEVYSDRMLIELLSILIGKSTHTQTIFGAGNNNSYSSGTSTGVKKSGTMDTNGLFWGSQDNKSGVKIFGMENIYGNTWRAVAGWINNKGTQKIKMTYGQSDGSTVDGYNLDGDGYISIANSTPSGTSGGYINNSLFSENGLIPITASGSATTYYCDGFRFGTSDTYYCIAGGGSANTNLVGIFALTLNANTSESNTTTAAALSCKPLAPTT